MKFWLITKKQIKELHESLVHTIKTQYVRLTIILLIAFLALLYNTESSFHIFTEFLGVAFIFLVVEHYIKKLESGIYDPEKLPIEKFINDILTAKTICIYDIFLESFILDDNNYKLFKTNLLNNQKVKCKILLLNHSDTKNDDYIKNRAAEMDIGPDEYKIKMTTSYERLLELQQCAQSKIDIKLHNEEPLFAMYCIEGKYSYFSFYPQGAKSTDSRQLYAPEDTEFGKNTIEFFKKKQFEKIWKNI